MKEINVGTQRGQIDYYRKFVLTAWVVLWPLVLVAFVYPISFGSLRLFLLIGVIHLWGGALWLFWKQRLVRYGCLVVAVVTGAVTMLPGYADDAAALRQEYVNSLLRYEGTRYVWGGESKLGIDCSGLPRCALMSANLKRGVLTANPQLIRESMGLWWFDSSAKALMEGYRGKTRVLLSTPAINQLDHSRIMPGDFAVTSSGVHALAYVGDQSWIEADPGPANRVILLKVPGSSAWLNTPVHIMRWRQFESA